MKNTIKKAISVLLVAVMVFGAAPLAGFVGLDLPELNLFSTKAEAATSGTCGDNLTWSLNTYTGRLTISGTGDMYDYSIIHTSTMFANTPWWESIDAIKSVLINEGVTCIGDAAFFGCINLTNITIPDGVTTIGFCALEGCSSLTSVTIPDTVIEIDSNAFDDCESLTSITVDKDNPNYSSDNYGVLFNKDKTKLILYPRGNTRISYAIPDGVTYIGYDAFDNCESLKFVTIPTSLTSISNSPFSSCKSLTSITVDKDNPNYSSDEYGVLFNKDKTEIVRYPQGNTRTRYVFPESVTGIGNYAFAGCTYIGSIIIPDGVTSIGDHAFYGCTGIKGITIPDNITSIGDYAFYGCTNLVRIVWPETFISIGDYALDNTALYNDSSNWDGGVFYCGPYLIKSTENISGSYTVKDGTKFISDNAFYRMYSYSQLTEITLPDGITHIGASAFLHSEKLTNITIPDSVVYIGDSSFYGCEALESITIPDGVEYIGFSAFSGCKVLKSITIPDGVRVIEHFTFSGCASLESITIPDSVLYIGQHAFSGCSSITDITIPERVITIESFAFSQCTGLTNITIPNGVRRIGDVAFGGCTGLKSVVLPYTLGGIDSYAFMNCTNLEYVHIPENTTNIGYDVFEDATSYICSDTENCYAKTYANENGFVFKVCDGHGADKIVSGKCGDNLTYAFDTSSGELVINGTGDMWEWNDDTIYFYSSAMPWFAYRFDIKTVSLSDGITSISDSSFSSCTNLTSINIPDSVTSIGDYAFSRCTKLTSITIPDSVTSIGNDAFNKCSGLASITVDKNNTNYSSDSYGVLFNKDKTELICYPQSNTRTTYEIPTGVTSIAYSAFYYCANLENITIPDSVTNIGNYAFYYCKSLVSITIPDSVTEISHSAFGSCTNLTSITIPDGVISIDDNAFYGCANLSKVYIPGDMEYIGVSVFTKNLTDVYYPGTEEDWNEILIDKGNSLLLNATIHYGHVHAEKVLEETVEATCDENGYKVYSCVCGCRLTEEILALEHDVIIDKAVEATCTETGLTEGQHCSRCDDATIEQEVVPALEHDIVIDEAVDATCTETGLTEGQHCSRCDDATIEQKETPVLGHTESDAVVENNSDAKCGQAGSYDSVVYCSACGEEISRETITVDALEHQYDEVVTAPTCTEIGYTTYTCSLCGDYYVSDEVEELGHDIIIDESVDATCTETGFTEGQHCSRCDDETIEQEVVPVLGHDIIIDEAVDATCTETGLTEGQHCSRCDDMTVEQKIVPVKPHNHIAKYDSAKHWEECVCGSKINSQTHVFIGGNTCSCGFKRVVDSAIKIRNNNGSKTINYGETLKLTAIVTNKPSNAKIYWYVDGVKKGEGEVFNVNFENGTKIITVKLVDENGVVYQNANFDEITDSENVTVNGGFFQKIISFFKNLFGMNRTVVQTIFKGIY